MSRTDIDGPGKVEYASEIDKVNGICIVRVSGEFRRPDDSDELKHYAVDMFTKHQCSRFLIDMTKADVVGETMAIFDAANPRGEEAIWLRMIKTAFVRLELSADDRFYETVAVNRGFQLRAFDALDAAVEWLRHEDSG